MVDAMLSDDDFQQVAELLGREPRGLQAIPVRRPDGSPAVLQVASLVDSKPFPTLYWLVDKTINYGVDRLEAGGFIAELQARVDLSEAYKARLVRDHQAYIARRQSFMSEKDKQEVARLGFTEPLEKRGIGGIENFNRIRCLHTYYAAHLVEPNLVGEWMDQHWAEQGFHFDL